MLLLDILGGTALVYRYAGYVFGVEQKKPFGIIEQLWEQMKAKNVNEFKDAVARQQMPMFTYIYADHNGDTFYQSNSWTPDYSGQSDNSVTHTLPTENLLENTGGLLRRSIEPLRRGGRGRSNPSATSRCGQTCCSLLMCRSSDDVIALEGLPLKYDWKVATGPPVPVDDSSLIWSNIVPWVHQPQLTSPPSGFISNANDPPWYATLPAHAPDPNDYLDYPWIATFPTVPDTGTAFGWRPRACIRRTMEAMGRKANTNSSASATAGGRRAVVGATFEAFVEASMSVQMESAVHARASLIEVLKKTEVCTAS